MKLTDLIGNGSKLSELMRSAQAGRIVHAFLFTGVAGTGRHTAARLFIQGLFCAQPAQDGPCGTCPACRRVDENTHPDVHVLDVPADRKEIPVDRIRGLIDDISVRPYEGKCHAVIIEQADRMNDSAQNALLKTLETPPVETVFFLLSEHGNLLPTIVSRCQRVRFPTLTVEDCERVLLLRGIAPERARLLAGLCGGSVGRALSIDQDPEYFQMRGRVIGALGLMKGPENALEAVSMLVKDKDRRQDVLAIMEGVARDQMVLQNGADSLGQAAELSYLTVDGARLLLSLQEVRRRLSRNISWQNALEYLFLSISAQGKTGG